LPARAGTAIPKSAGGRSPACEIRRVRLAHAIDLLKRTNLLFLDGFGEAAGIDVDGQGGVAEGGESPASLASPRRTAFCIALDTAGKLDTRLVWHTMDHHFLVSSDRSRWEASLNAICHSITDCLGGTFIATSFTHG
jgi:hypothetical protein